MKTSNFVVGDRVSNLRHFSEDQKVYGVVEQVVGLRYLVRWDRDAVRTIPNNLQRSLWEDSVDLILESRGEEEHMRTFTKEEKDYILDRMADPANDTYIAGAIVKDAKAVWARTRRISALTDAAELIVNALGAHLGKYGLSSIHQFPMVPPDDEKRIEMHTTNGIYTITLREKV